MGAESNSGDSVARRAEEYYDSGDADLFYYRIWGGEDIHIGIYGSEDEEISVASSRADDRMISLLPERSETLRIVDLGAGYGGSARAIVRRMDAHVACLNLSEIQNDRNREKNREAGLQDRVDVVYGNFEELPFGDGEFDVVWSQEAFLHSASRDKIFEEVNRVLRPGGQLLFTDPLQTETADPKALQPVLDRIHLDSLGSVSVYRAMAERLGWNEATVSESPDNLRIHYTRVQQELRRHADALRGEISSEYIERMDAGLSAWIEAARAGALSWGLFQFVKP